MRFAARACRPLRSVIVFGSWRHWADPKCAQIALPIVQTLSDVMDLVVDGDGDPVMTEGAADVVDCQVLDRRGRVAADRN